MKNVTRYILMMLVFYLTLPMTAALSQALKADEIKPLVNDKTWEMVFKNSGAKTGTFARIFFWDWKQDGTICARLISAPKNDACADQGRWRLDGNHLCWELTWFEKAAGLNKQCISVHRVPERGFQAQLRQHPGLELFNFSVVN